MSALVADAVRLIEMTDVQGTAHLVTDAAMITGRRTGHYTTICGGQVTAASLTVRESGYCHCCHARRTGR